MKLTAKKFGTETLYRTENGAFAGSVFKLSSRGLVWYRVDTINGYAGEVRTIKEAKEKILSALEAFNS